VMKKSNSAIPHMGVPPPLSYIPPICEPAKGNRMVETILPTQKIRYNAEADKKPKMKALTLNFRCSFRLGCSQKDSMARVAAENEIFIQKVAQVR